ncbi:putative disease resistance protein RGA3 [Triticum dicoccoides]|nr:putative disease resistance protein RGA3 [Triticum dicoccoides]XP_044321506.1 putative disease resistance protein RGA3 [Triticum aestivum]
MVLVPEVAVAVSVMGWFLSPHITELMKVARDCATTNYMLYWGGKKKLEKLVEDLEDIKRLLDPASTAFVKNQAKLEQLWRLKDDIHDIEEILDSFQVEIRNAEATSSSNLSKKKKIYDNKVMLMGKLVKVLKSVGETRKRARDLQRGAQQGAPCSILARRETGPNSVRDQKSFFGYQKEYAQLISLLQKQPDGNKVDIKVKLVIAIVGHAGMGKTELARQAFRTAEDKFDLGIWVHAYGKNTEFELLKEIWKSVAGHKPVGEMNVACLQRELRELLASKRCLLVLDDVWNHELAADEAERKHAWQALDLFTRCAQDGSRIVMTTRAKICSATFKADASIILDGIKDKEMTFLLNHTANGTTENSDHGVQERIEKQVSKLKGSPLAAVEIGEDLEQKTTSKEKCDIFDDIQSHLGTVYQQHLFTYQHLQPHLQRCFQFCSIFPYNWRFEPDKLCKMWMALGFVEEMTLSTGVSSMEDVTRGYFDDLVNRSLFQLEQSKGGGDKQARYVIHEQIHWMIRLASKKNCISISGDSTSVAKTSIPETVRHLSVASNCLDELRKKYPSSVLNKMRTLLVLKNDDDSKSSTVDKGILKLFKGVRVLDLTAATGLTHLPGTIHNLKHVRYLGLPSTMRNLCDEVTELFFLQTFSLDGKKQNTCRLQKFPKHMNKLVNMRHLDIDMECIANINGIGRMAKLQGPIEFKAIRSSEKEGHAVSELAGMDSLRGTLSIKGLDDVPSKEEAMKARLEQKSAVKVLKLEWGPPDPRRVNGGPADSDAVAVLEGLQPHRDLHELRITRYPGATSPSWLGVKMEKLTSLYLRNCRKLNALPVLGELPCLELLDVKELSCVETIDSDFCGAGTFLKLKKVVLDDMPGLLSWGDMPKLAFPELTEVSIVDCPRLSSLSGLELCAGPLSLRVKGCPHITPETLKAITGISNYKFH